MLPFVQLGQNTVGKYDIVRIQRPLLLSGSLHLQRCPQFEVQPSAPKQKSKDNDQNGMTMTKIMMRINIMKRIKTMKSIKIQWWGPKCNHADQNDEDPYAMFTWTIEPPMGKSLVSWPKACNSVVRFPPAPLLKRAGGTKGQYPGNWSSAANCGFFFIDCFYCTEVTNGRKTSHKLEEDRHIQCTMLYWKVEIPPGW